MGKRAKQLRNEEKRLEQLKKVIFEEAKQRYYDNLSGATNE
jgi:hypothetical protein